MEFTWNLLLYELGHVQPVLQERATLVFALRVTDTGRETKPWFSHRDVLCVHELHSKVVGLHQINMVHDLIEEILAFGFTLQQRERNRTGNVDWTFLIHQVVYK